MIEIKLTKGQVAIIDDCDADLILRKWYFQSSSHKGSINGYAKRRIAGKQQGLHRLIMERVIGRALTTHELVDHINCDSLDCRRENLRIATSLQSVANRRKQKISKQPYKGIGQRTASSWFATIKINGKSKSLGSYPTPELAHAAYCEAAKKYFGEFARFD